MITHHIMPAIFTYSMAKDFDAVANAMHTVADVHIKLDTGMSRIGFKSDAESIEATVQGIVMINSLLKNCLLYTSYGKQKYANRQWDHC